MKRKISSIIIPAMLLTLITVSGCGTDSKVPTSSSEGSNSKSTVSSEASTVTEETTTAKDLNARYASVLYKRTSVHDPSIVKADGKYYVFGSHRAWSESEDLMSWSTIDNNINYEYSTMFKDLWTNYCKTSNNPSVSGNMWAPDVIYNKTMKKYCMYMSINGSDYNSSIVLLTSDSINGPYENKGSVIFSGFNKTNHPAKYTDVYDILGKDADLSRYQSTKDSKINAIDPCVTYDSEGNLWMSYGSWFGGIFLMKLDPATGLRDKSTTYKTVADKSDEYYGYKIAGGHEVSGEGSYIINTNGYYYLFLSYGGLTATGGYQMRVFRSKEINGPYVDEKGNSAIFKKSGSNLTSDNGVRLMGSYTWSGSNEIHVAQGHNSALIDDDGKIYLVYHTRFSNKGEEHQVRVQQMFINSDGWLITAPYEFAGESLPEKSYSTEEVTGDYEFIIHMKAAFFQHSAMGDIGVIKPKNIKLNDDGTVTGEDIQSGTWTQDKNTSAMTITVDGTEYKGYFIEMPNEADHKIVMTFTALGNNITVYGSKTVSNPN